MRASNALVAVIVGLLAFALLVATGDQIGLTYDEPIYLSKSMLACEWLSALSQGRDATREAAISLYWDASQDQQPGSIKLMFGIVGRLLGNVLAVPALTAGRLGTMLLSAVLVGLLYWFAAGLWGRSAGAVAAGGLLLMPRVWTHMHLAALDAPIMALSFVTVLLVFLAARDERPWLCVAAGVMFGLALGTKLNSFFIPIIVLPWLLVMRKWRIAGWTAASMAILGPLTLWVTWPWLWHDTWARAGEYFAFHLHHYHVATTYLGTTWELAPWHYAVAMTLITTPPTILVLAVVGVCAALTRQRQGAAAATTAISDASCGWGVCLLLVWGLAVNLGPSMLPWAPKYNGVRLFLPVFPYLAAFGGVGFHRLCQRVIQHGAETWSKSVVGFPVKLRAFGALLVIIPCLAAVGNAHPFGMSYYNSLIGGPSGAYELGMEPTYWGDSYLAAVQWLNRNGRPGAEAWINVVGFASSVDLYKALGMLREDVQITAGDEALSRADYVVVQHKQNEMSPLMQRLAAEGTPLFAETLDGVPLVWVFAGDDPALRGEHDGRAAQ